MKEAAKYQTKLLFAEIVDSIQYKDWILNLCDGEDGRWYLQVAFMAIDTMTGKPALQKGRKWMLSPYMCRNEIVSTCFKAIEAAEMHELRENFKFRGKAIFGPHIDPDALVEIADKINVRR